MCIQFNIIMDEFESNALDSENGRLRFAFYARCAIMHLPLRTRPRSSPKELASILKILYNRFLEHDRKAVGGSGTELHNFDKLAPFTAMAVVRDDRMGRGEL